MNLLEIMAAHRGLFYSQIWYKDESFLRTLPNERTPRSPLRVIAPGKVPRTSRDLPLAVDLVAAYVRDPLNPVYDGWLWCRDVDRFQQRIFLGGLSQGKGLQLHRHLDIDANWGVPSWR